MDDLPLQKITISGPTLSSLMHRISTSLGDVDGLLFGHVTHFTPSALTDDDPPQNPTADSSNLIATITSFFCPSSPLSFYDSLGRVDSASLHRFISSTHHQKTHEFLGWFSARRKSPIRPSMREFCVSHSLNTQLSSSAAGGGKNLKNPCVFLLFTTPVQGGEMYHTHEYRAYQFRVLTTSFEPKTIGIENIGPDFRGNYGCFTPNSPFPELNCDLRSVSAMNEDRNDELGERLSGMRRVSKDQKQLDSLAEGFGVGDLGKLMGTEAANYTMGLEDLYEKMLAKLDNLAREVEKSNAKVLEMEDHNRKLRYKVARNGPE